MVLPDGSHQLALLIRIIEVARPHLKPPPLMLPQGDHRRRLVWLLVRLLRLVGWPAASWIQLRYEDGGGIFFPKRASQTHRRYFCVRQLNTSSTSSTAETFFEVRTADGADGTKIGTHYRI